MTTKNENKWNFKEFPSRTQTEKCIFLMFQFIYSSVQKIDLDKYYDLKIVFLKSQKSYTYSKILNIKTLKGKIRQYSWSISAGYQLSS
jgi:hypothetical protein